VMREEGRHPVLRELGRVVAQQHARMAPSLFRSQGDCRVALSESGNGSIPPQASARTTPGRRKTTSRSTARRNSASRSPSPSLRRSASRKTTSVSPPMTSA
jgi:hypothetical protein